MSVCDAALDDDRSMTLGENKKSNNTRVAELFSCRRRRRRCFSLACVSPHQSTQSRGHFRAGLCHVVSPQPLFRFLCYLESTDSARAGATLSSNIARRSGSKRGHVRSQSRTQSHGLVTLPKTAKDRSCGSAPLASIRTTRKARVQEWRVPDSPPDARCIQTLSPHALMFTPPMP